MSVGGIPGAMGADAAASGGCITVGVGASEPSDAVNGVDGSEHAAGMATAASMATAARPASPSQHTLRQITADGSLSQTKRRVTVMPRWFLIHCHSALDPQQESSSTPEESMIQSFFQGNRVLIAPRFGTVALWGLTSPGSLSIFTCYSQNGWESIGISTIR